MKDGASLHCLDDGLFIFNNNEADNAIVSHTTFTLGLLAKVKLYT